MFLPLDILLEYWIEHVSFELLYAMFTFSTRIFCRGVPGFATDCPCGVRCRGLTTCHLTQGKTIFFVLIVSHLNALKYNTLFSFTLFLCL